MYLVYSKYWTLNLMPLMVYPKVSFHPNLSIRVSINVLQKSFCKRHWGCSSMDTRHPELTNDCTALLMHLKASEHASNFFYRVRACRRLWRGMSGRLPLLSLWQRGLAPRATMQPRATAAIRCLPVSRLQNRTFWNPWRNMPAKQGV